MPERRDSTAGTTGEWTRRGDETRRAERRAHGGDAGRGADAGATRGPGAGRVEAAHDEPRRKEMDAQAPAIAAGDSDAGLSTIREAPRAAGSTTQGRAPGFSAAMARAGSRASGTPARRALALVLGAMFVGTCAMVYVVSRMSKETDGSKRDGEGASAEVAGPRAGGAAGASGGANAADAGDEAGVHAGDAAAGAGARGPGAGGGEWGATAGGVAPGGAARAGSGEVEWRGAASAGVNPGEGAGASVGGVEWRGAASAGVNPGGVERRAAAGASAGGVEWRGAAEVDGSGSPVVGEPAQAASGGESLWVPVAQADGEAAERRRKIAAQARALMGEPRLLACLLGHVTIGVGRRTALTGSVVVASDGEVVRASVRGGDGAVPASARACVAAELEKSRFLPGPQAQLTVPLRLEIQ